MFAKYLSTALYGIDDKNRLKGMELTRDRQNYRTAKTLSALMILILIMVTIVTLLLNGRGAVLPMDNLMVYVVGIVLSAVVLWIVEKYKSMSSAAVFVLVYTEATVVNGVLIYLGTVAIGNENAVLINLGIATVSVLISDYPYRIAVYDFLVAGVFLIASYAIKDNKHFMSDAVNACVSLITGICLAMTTRYIRVSDWLNRRSLEKEFMIDRFINNMITYAGDSESPEQTISNILEYIGIELNADRAYVFEGDKNGSYDNTFEWCNEGVTSQKDNLQNIPYEGVLDSWIQSFENNENIVISDMEECRRNDPDIYRILADQDIKTLVAGPIKVNNKIIGFYGVDNVDDDIQSEVADIIRFAEFFFGVIFQFRNQTNEIKEVSYHDQLTGLKNRHALMESAEKDKDDKSLAIIMFDVNGLKIMNDSYGHKAGDDLLCRAAASLTEVFGEENVYRMGGDEYLVFDKKINKEQMNEKVEELREILKRNDVSMSVGALYLEDTDLPIDELMKMSDALMYKEKKRYYEQSGKDRRSR